MRKLLILVNILLSLSVISRAATLDGYEIFIDAHGTERKIRPIREEDFAHPLLTKDINADLYKQRCRDNQAGIFVVESINGDIIASLRTGRMPFGYQPWPPQSVDDEQRSSQILSFYAALLESIGIEISPTKKHREGASIDLIHINPKVLALTVTLGGDFGTLSAQEAIVRLVRSNKMMIVRDPGVTESGYPTFCLSITQMPDLESTSSTRVYKGLPYYPPRDGNDGLYWAAVTLMVDNALLPLEYAIKEWSVFEDRSTSGHS